MKQLISLVAVTATLISGAASALTFSAQNASVQQIAGVPNLYVNGELAQYVAFKGTGTYQITVRAGGTPVGGVYPVMALTIDGIARDRLSVTSSTAYAPYVFQANLSGYVHKIGFRFLNDALSATEDRNIYFDTITIASPSGVADATLSTEAAWTADGPAREEALLVTTNNAIQQYRMGAAEVVVVDANGTPVPDATVTVEQTSHDFLFGASIMGWGQFDTVAQNELYKSEFDKLFNYATAPLYWYLLEQEQDKPNYALVDEIVTWCKAHDIVVKGHPLLWDAWAGIPAWMSEQPDAALQQAHIQEVMQRYQSSIANWEVVNEPANCPGVTLDPAYRWARAVDPNAYLIVNEYNVMPDGYPAFFDMLQNAVNNGLPFNAIGIQAHAPLDMAFPLDQVQMVLDEYSKFGKDIHITEFIPSANGNPVLGSPWRGTWDEAAQADYAESFYRVCFAHPSCTAITWWDICDTGGWGQNGGLLRADLSEKPVYEALNGLINNEWHTRVQSATAVEGTVDFRGFYGDYNAVVTFGDAVEAASFHLAEGADNTVVVMLDIVQGQADTTPPVITLAGSTPVTVAVGGSYVDAGATAVDETDGNLTASIVTVNPVNPAVVGTYTVTYNVKDCAGNAAAQVTRTVLVKDTTKPVITRLGLSSVTVQAGATYTDAGATATDNYDGNLTAAIVVVNPVKTNVIGTYKVTYNVKDSSGNAAAQVTRTVYVKDTTKPVITRLGLSSVTVQAGAAYTDAGATALDSFEGDLTSRIVTVNPVNTSALGTYTVTYNVKDTAGNAAVQVSRTVYVKDTTKPVITRLGSATVTVEADGTYVDAGATALDSFEGNLTSRIVTVNPVNVNILGAYTVTYNVKDSSGNAAVQVTRSVTVKDTTKPVITLNGAATVKVTLGAVYADEGATAYDDYEGDITGSLVTVNSVDATVLGTYTVTYNVKDASGNAAAQVTRTVVVEPATLTLASPRNGATYYLPDASTPAPFAATIQTAVELTDVVYMLDGVPFGTSSEAPFAVTNAINPVVYGWGEHEMVVTAAVADSTTTVSASSTFTLAPLPVGADADGNGIPDNAFATLANNGDAWFDAVTVADTGKTRSAALIRFTNDLATPVTAVLNGIEVTVPRAVLEAGEYGLVLVESSADLATLFGADDAALFAAAPENFTVVGDSYVQVSVLVSTDGHSTFTEVDNARLAAHPVHLEVSGLALSADGGEVVYSHPTYVDSNATTGLLVIAAEGAWTTTETANVVFAKDGFSADLTALSSVVALYAPEAQPQVTVIGMIGDVNKDGVIEEFDFVLMQYIESWGVTALNNYLASNNMNVVDIRLADVDLDGQFNNWDTTMEYYTLQLGLAAVNAYCSANNLPLCRIGETLSE